MLYSNTGTPWLACACHESTCLSQGGNRLLFTEHHYYLQLTFLAIFNFLYPQLFFPVMYNCSESQNSIQAFPQHTVEDTGGGGIRQAGGMTNTD